MSSDYTGIPARCDVTLARPGDEAGVPLLADDDLALVLTDDRNITVITIEGTPAELFDFVRRTQQALQGEVGVTSPPPADCP
ncbi:hypothetical protein [Amycolatopsis sp. lyj-23]|uniref:hypothetical protein n=1 Tax=Amycolatopsis sp. lyj-23 TaxID=2789283 RepID=UPI00397D8A10